MGITQNRHYYKAKHWVKAKVPMHYKVAVIAWISRFISGGAQLISVAIILRYLGTHYYALFALMIGLQGWFGLADLGFGASIQNAISKARVARKDITPILSNAYVLLLGTTIVFITVYVIFSPFLQYALFHKVDSEFAHHHYEMLILLGVIYILTYLWNVVNRVLLATQRGYLAYIYQGLGPVLSLMAISLFCWVPLMDTDRLLGMLLAWITPPCLVTLVSCFCHFPMRQIRQNIDLQCLKNLFRQGVKFLGFSTLWTLIFAMDYVVMSQTLAANEITIYNILAKGYGIIYYIYLAVLAALWPEIAELFAQNKWDRANHLIQRNLFMGLGFILVCTLFVILLKHFIVEILAPASHLFLPTSSILWFCVSYIMQVWTYTYVVALQSQNYLRVFSVMIIQAFINAFGMYYLSLRFGMNGILMGTVISIALTIGWILPLVYYKRKILFQSQ